MGDTQFGNFEVCFLVNASPGQLHYQRLHACEFFNCARETNNSAHRRSAATRRCQYAM